MIENKNRRKFLLNTSRSVGLASFGGLMWGAYLEEVTAKSFSIRPPAALSEKEFLKTCIKCGLCVNDCPYDTLSLAQIGDGKATGTPYFTPRETPCYMCEDIPCVKACPTDALDEKLVTTNNELDINKSQMGVAILDEKNCVAFWGIRCDVCYRACPLLGKAIDLKYERNDRTGKHAFFKPVVDSDHCTGCGLCENACITKKPSIIVLPREEVLGSVGNHYNKGWNAVDEKSSDIFDANKLNDKSKSSAIDFLNDGKELY